MIARLTIVLITLLLTAPANAGPTQEQVIEACRNAGPGTVEQCHATVKAFIAATEQDRPGSDEALAELAYQLISLSLADPDVKDAIVDALDLLAKAASSQHPRADWSRA